MFSSDTAATGYLHPDYAASLAEFGRPRHLPLSDGWILERPVAGAGGVGDAMGPYPLFACRDWSRLAEDLDALAGSGLVSLVLVADPFGNWTEDALARCFPDRLMQFKDHFVADLSVPLADFVDSHHRRNVRKALKRVEVERVEQPLALHPQWCALYCNLIARHSLRGISVFSPEAFRRQLAVPGLSMFCACAEGEVVGIALWYELQARAYYHLAAYSERGYALGASFALFWRAFEHFAASGVRLLELGAGAGAQGDAEDGLTRFKRGWSSGTRPAYLCGRLFDPPRYRRLVQARGVGETAYFPAYRLGEFA